MKLVVQLYIDTSGNPIGTPTYERVEMFDFETIELTSSIQEVRDIGSVFTDFSQSFSVPASQVNNKILKHYYNTELNESFDARIKQRALISLNGITFKEGYIRLSEVSVKKGEPSSYSLTFFGSLVNLKQALGDDELQDLVTLDLKYKHEYNIDNVYDGFIDGLGLIGDDMVKSSNRDIIYPAISASNKWYYSTNPSDLGEQPYKQGEQVNIWTNGDTSLQYGINYTQLKPAIKVKNIIIAIEELYASKGIVFKYDEQDDFFNSVEFNQLYLLLHNFKGTILASDEASKYRDYNVGTSDVDSDFKVDSGEQELRPIEVSYVFSFFGSEIVSYDLQLDIDTSASPSGAEYTVELLEGETIIDSKTLTTSGSMTTTLEPETQEAYFNKVYNNLKYRIKSSGELNEFELDLFMSKTVVTEDITDPYNPTIDRTLSQYALEERQQQIVSEINITKYIPKIKTYDFLKGLFNMFNLTAYVEDGLIIVKKLDKFYNSGGIIDISNQVDTESIDIKRMQLYSDISFKFNTPKTFGVINQNEVNQDEFGDLDQQGDNGSLIFDGDKYDIKVPFEKLFFEGLSDENSISSDIYFGNGWLVDKDQNETDTAPVLFFNRNTSVPVGTEIGFKDKSYDVTSYNRPSNSSDNELSTIHFGAEQDEFSGNTITNSLFELNYKRYITNVFNPKSRMYVLKAYLNLRTILDYNMNDTFVINQKEFFINNIRTDLSTGSTDLELIPSYDTVDVLPPDTEAPTVPTNLSLQSKTDRNITINWTESTDNVAVTGYELWIDDSFYETLGIGSMYVITGLNPDFQTITEDGDNIVTEDNDNISTENTIFKIQLLAFDASNNKSALSEPLFESLDDPQDNTAPTVPTNLVLGIATSSSIGFLWDASTDNIEVTGYKVYVNGVFNQTVTQTSVNVTGLSSNTSYNLSVSAIDAALNESKRSIPITGTTTQGE